MLNWWRALTGNAGDSKDLAKKPEPGFIVEARASAANRKAYGEWSSAVMQLIDAHYWAAAAAIIHADHVK